MLDVMIVVSVRKNWTIIIMSVMIVVSAELKFDDHNDECYYDCRLRWVKNSTIIMMSVIDCRLRSIKKKIDDHNDECMIVVSAEEKKSTIIIIIVKIVVSAE